MQTRFDPFVLFIALLFGVSGLFTGQGLAAPSTSTPAAALGTQFVYEGRIGTVTGTYDLQFRLWNAATSGALVGSPSTVLANDIRLNQGQYQVFLNFGTAAFTGQALFLEVGYRPGTSTGAYTIQAARQPILPVAYALSLRPGAVIDGSQIGASLRVNNAGEGVGLWGSGNNDPGVYGTSNTSNGVSGVSGGANPAAGVYGQSTAGRGVWGKSGTGQGVYGQSTSQAGVVGESQRFDGGFFRSRSATAAGVSGHNDAGGYGVYGRSTTGYAGFFEGKTATRVLEIRGGSDLAEKFDVQGSDTVEPGTLMVIDTANPGKLKMSDAAYDPKVAGVISGAGGVRPGLTLHQEGVMDGDHVVAIAGRVYVKAEALSAPIQPGDILTSSAVSGHVMRATERDRAYGAVIGKAMTGLDRGTGMVLVLVNLQ